MQNRPMTLAEAIDNLHDAFIDMLTAIAAALSPALKRLQDEGFVDHHGHITAKGYAAINERKKLTETERGLHEMAAAAGKAGVSAIQAARNFGDEKRDPDVR